jgi:hypothetical protein
MRIGKIQFTFGNRSYTDDGEESRVSFRLGKVLGAVPRLQGRTSPTASLMTGVIFLLCATCVVADDETNKTEATFIEPILIEETMPNDPGEWSLRLTTDYRRSDGEAVGTLPNFEVFYGIVERLGASLSIPTSYTNQDAISHYGLGDISASLKYLVVKPAPKMPALVLGLETTFPTGKRTLGLGDGAYELAPNLALLKEFGPICVQGYFGWDKQVSAQRTDMWTYGWAISAPLVKDKLHLLTEIQGDWGSPNHTTLAPGIKYNFTDKLTAGLAVPVGLNKNTEGLGIVTQFQIEF